MTSVKTAYTTKELAALLGITRQGTDYRAASENWQSRPRKGKGGGKEWLLESMPAETRIQIANALIKALNIVQPKQVQLPLPVQNAPLPERQRDRAEARMFLARMAETFWKQSGQMRTVAFTIFSDRYNKNELEVPAWVRQTVKGVCQQSLVNWLEILSKAGVNALAGKYGHRRGSGVFDKEEVRQFCLAHIFEFPHAGPGHIYKGLCARFRGRDDVSMPTLRRLQQWHKDWLEKNKELFAYVSNPDEWKNKFQAAFGTSAALVTRLNEEWQLDNR